MPLEGGHEYHGHAHQFGLSSGGPGGGAGAAGAGGDALQIAAMPVGFHGLDNPVGSNNCFLNGVVQALFHLIPFRVEFLASEAHQHGGDVCLFCALQNVFLSYVTGTNDIRLTVLRLALDSLYEHDARFKLGDYGDASEAYEAVLNSIHALVVGDDSSVCNPPCVAHAVFAQSMLQQSACSVCGEAGEPLIFNQLTENFFVAEIDNHFRHLYKSTGHRPPFEAVLRACLESDPPRHCSNDRCGLSSRVQHHILNRPPVFALGLSWPSARSDPSQIATVLNAISERLDLGQVFASAPAQSVYRLRAAVRYYGFHYDCIVRDESSEQWVVANDRAIREVGGSLRDALLQTAQIRGQLALLFYELCNDEADARAAHAADSAARDMHAIDVAPDAQGSDATAGASAAVPAAASAADTGAAAAASAGTYAASHTPQPAAVMGLSAAATAAAAADGDPRSFGSGGSASRPLAAAAPGPPSPSFRATRAAAFDEAEPRDAAMEAERLRKRSAMELADELLARQLQDELDRGGQRSAARTRERSFDPYDVVRPPSPARTIDLVRDGGGAMTAAGPDGMEAEPLIPDSPTPPPPPPLRAPPHPPSARLSSRAPDALYAVPTQRAGGWAAGDRSTGLGWLSARDIAAAAAGALGLDVAAVRGDSIGAGDDDAQDDLYGDGAPATAGWYGFDPLVRQPPAAGPARDRTRGTPHGPRHRRQHRDDDGSERAPRRP